MSSFQGMQEVAQQAAASGSGTRLWPAMGRPFRRTLPPRGADVLGDRLRGVVARRWARSTDLKRAERVLEHARSLRDASEAALDDRIARVRERVILHRDDRRAVDEAGALVHEVVRRTLGLELHREQIMGGLAMADGSCVEMATGEGKTVTAILPAAVDGWLGRGVHVITVNDYLARRDAETTGPAYARLGLSVGVIQDQTEPPHRRMAYERDITYAADKQVIFDHLRDRLHSPVRQRLAALLIDQALELEGAVRERAWDRLVVQRGLYAAIIDEADSVLIDEAVTPAIIGMDRAKQDRDEAMHHHRVAAGIARELVEGQHFAVDRRLRKVRLTDAGRAAVAQRADELPAFWAGPMRREELLVQALSARALYLLGEDYVVREGEVVIVDRSTGRILEGRQWQLGVHQAVEAKEGLESISAARETHAQVSYQRFFQRYRRLSGMSGTVWEVGDELWRDYALPVVRIPTHRPIARTRARDRVFRSEAGKLEAMASRIEHWHRLGRPVLVGTRSVNASEELGAVLAERGVACRVLNAVREAEEAEIVAQAGGRGSVTVATNMAGRGTDITLTPETRELGGLVVIAGERNDEWRVDRQLYGRSGRQGDPGLAETFVSLDDDLIRRHGSGLLTRLCRMLPPGAMELVTPLLWWSSQKTASGRARLARSESMRQEADLDLAMHHEGR